MTSPVMKRVVIESPYSGPTTAIIARNLRYLRACMRDCLLRGESPIASHALYTQPGVLDDTVPADRELGMRAGWNWFAVVDYVVVYVDLGISPGMQRGMVEAERAGRPFVYRKLISWVGIVGQVDRGVSTSCTGCDAPLERCGPALWAQQRKCCPDCSHAVEAL